MNGVGASARRVQKVENFQRPAGELHGHPPASSLMPPRDAGTHPRRPLGAREQRPRAQAWAGGVEGVKRLTVRRRSLIACVGGGVKMRKWGCEDAWMRV